MRLLNPVVAAAKYAFLTVAPAGFCTWIIPPFALFVPRPSVDRLISPFSETCGSIDPKSRSGSVKGILLSFVPIPAAAIVVLRTASTMKAPRS